MLTSPSFFFNSLSYDNFLDFSKLKAFADDNINMAEKLKFVFGRVENRLGKRRKCWLPAFSPFPTLFSKIYSSGSLKVWIVW